jgi:hypothetical protein
MHITLGEMKRFRRAAFGGCLHIDLGHRGSVIAVPEEAFGCLAVENKILKVWSLGPGGCETGANKARRDTAGGLPLCLNAIRLGAPATILLGHR